MRKLPGLIAFTIPREQGLLQMGMLDENIFPIFHDDDEYAVRAFVAGKNHFMLETPIYHGKAGKKVGLGYVSGTESAEY